MALDKRATIVIMTFHKQWAIDGGVESLSHAIQTLNINVLKKAPCSVGILVDRENLSRLVSVLTRRLLLQVAALFIGGQDDIESLSYAFRMARHKSVRLVVTRYFLQFGAENTKDRKRDCYLINEFKHSNTGNKRFEYVEVVKDGETLAASLRGLVDCFDLILVERYHQDSAILSGLEE
ncbi:hypothetical protein Patl1_06704 [Pistacia atlantica]|uniref:Uncharacterized protein n=1 Tax=Pistacia atlantica TaxID=434234 RepID=A0ACC1BV44_9ROSI|nr:hypothetical protein Patl1_06704 [Pistacia atlantica]